MLRVSLFAAMIMSACSVPPLTTEDLTGGNRDASSVIADAAVVKADAPPDAAVVPDVAEPRRDAAPVPDGVLSGKVVDGCTKEDVSALVGIADKHKCSFPGKGGFYFTGLPTGIKIMLVSNAPGYKVFGKDVVLSSGGITVDILLTRVGASAEDPCAVPKPPSPMCSCLHPDCI